MPEHIGFFFELLDTHPRLFAAVIGLLGSFAATQFIKGMLPGTLGDGAHRRLTQLIAFISCYAFTLGFWASLIPGGRENLQLGHWIALADAFASPSLYWIAVRLLYLKWPQLEQSLSARPRNVDPAPIVPGK